MKIKKILFILILVLFIILISLFLIIKNSNSEDSKDNNTVYNEYTPEEEISSAQLRETIVTLYFVDENNNIKSEGRLIDSLKLLKNPYKELIGLLIEGPSSNNLSAIFPENVSILEASFNNGCVTLNFSHEILNYSNDVQKYNIINCALNTLSELNEVNSIKIIVNDNLCNDFSDEYSSLT